MEQVSSLQGAGGFLPGLALALAIGLLIGIERGWRARGEPQGGRVAGVRTFSILGLFGGLLGHAAQGPLQDLALIFAGGAVIALLLGYWMDMRRDGIVDATSAVAAVVTLGLGALAASGAMAIASVGAGALLLLLASRDALHRALDATTEADLRALVKLALVALVVLPLLPDRAVGPFGLNPQRLWLVVVTIGAISFAGYVLSRWLGARRGIFIAAGLGALVSSTAVTLESARQIRGGVEVAANEAAVALASVVMIARTLMLVALLAASVVPPLLPLVMPALLIAAAFAAALVYRAQRSPGDVRRQEVKPPGIGLALIFASLVAVLTVAASWAQARFGSESGALVIALGGMVDVDSAIAAIGALPPGRLQPALAAYAIAGPVLFNTLLKLGLVWAIAGFRPALRAVAALAGAAAGLLGVGIVQLL